ncbi:hypothetical protein CLAFUW4_12885 [Fulvia fulva]|uniref:Uncharacterized protein n=1 Tax=Passalora fulva TaxID=5499 RepID=A0A9Q8UVJ3_PASFU|nr:uncharacterized protein CLAFUR5_12751 [Fulvia fulva]KAK4611829.1 hypothetical protein CLAFUR4_12889 [Fulvia fulva]UJO23965.1 hypothetical protein CLAFUR5_12751 [Fulvia fulva]WPV21415.1 hypothetical protein CLAFUW4_12885 [Fulvia fulva]WPV36524.1 hypothetical protein CLAFUW7_12892 [Fulvia fulva]
MCSKFRIAKMGSGRPSPDSTLRECMNTPERISLVNAEPVLRRALQRALDDMASGQSAATFIVCARHLLQQGKIMDMSILRDRSPMPLCTKCVHDHLAALVPADILDRNYKIYIDNCTCASQLLAEGRCFWCAVEELHDWRKDWDSRYSTTTKDTGTRILKCPCGNTPVLREETLRICAGCEGLVSVPLHGLDQSTHLACVPGARSQRFVNGEAQGYLGSSTPCTAHPVVVCLFPRFGAPRKDTPQVGTGRLEAQAQSQDQAHRSRMEDQQRIAANADMMRYERQLAETSRIPQEMQQRLRPTVRGSGEHQEPVVPTPVEQQDAEKYQQASQRFGEQQQPLAAMPQQQQELTRYKQGPQGFDGGVTEYQRPPASAMLQPQQDVSMMLQPQHEIPRHQKVPQGFDRGAMEHQRTPAAMHPQPQEVPWYQQAPQGFDGGAI